MEDTPLAKELTTIPLALKLAISPGGELFQAPDCATGQEAATIKSNNMSGSLLLTDSKVFLARGVEFSSKVSEIRSSAVQTISSQSVGFDALQKMTKNRDTPCH